MFTPLEQFDIKIIKIITLGGSIDMSFTNFSFSLIFILILVYIVLKILIRTYKIIPGY
jgi:hypothetical protein